MHVQAATLQFHFYACPRSHPHPTPNSNAPTAASLPPLLPSNHPPLLRQDNSGWFVLSASAFVSWIFAKSILNASTLGASFGVVGGLAYASW